MTVRWQHFFLSILGVFALMQTLNAAEHSAELSAEQKSWLAEHPGLRMAPAPYYPPVEYFDDNDIYRGITADFMALMSERLGIETQVVQYPNWHHVVESTKRGDVDIWGAAAYTPERDEYMEFTRPYINLPAVIVVRKELQGWLTMNDLKGMRVVVIKNYASTSYVMEHYPDLNYIEVPDLETGLRMVSYSIADAIVATNAAALFYIERDGLTNLRVAGESGYEWLLRFAVRDELAPMAGIIQTGLDSISEDEKREIFRRWINLEYQEEIITTAQLVQLGAGGLILLVIVTVIWNRTLRRKVSMQTLALNAELEERRALEVTLRRLATTDELTGLMNRRHLFQELRRELARSERYGQSIAILLFDIDRFKKINDQYGHQVGDQVLTSVVDICGKELRKHDLFGRIGGEEFVIVLLEADLNQSVKVAERLCRGVEQADISIGNGESIQTTISIGVVCSDAHTPMEELLSIADQAMYRAKEAGRNRIEVVDQH